MTRLFTRPSSITAALAVTALCAIAFEVLATSTFAATPATRAAQVSDAISTPGSTSASPSVKVTSRPSLSLSARPSARPSTAAAKPSASTKPPAAAKPAARASAVPIATLTLRNLDTENVDFPLAAGPAAVRVGRESVTYRVAATSATGAAVSGQSVTFRLAGVSSIVPKDDLSTSAGDVVARGDVVVTTDGDGLAVLTVASGKTAANNAYSVTPRAGSNLSAGAITSTYTTAAPTTVTSGSSSAAKLGGSAELAGQVVDQWGQSISPSGMVAQLVLDSSTATGFKRSGSGLFQIQHDGTFDARVTDGTSPRTPHTDLYHWAVGLRSSPSRALEWVGSLTPATADLTSLRIGTFDTPLPFTSSAARVAIADSTNVHSSVLKGTVMDSSDAVLKYAKVTYTGSSGVYFVDRSQVPARFVTSLTTRTTSAGRLSSDQTTDGMSMAFTTSGPATIVIVSGSASDAVTVPVAKAVEPYRVTVQSATVVPRSSVVLQGQVQDLFGNPVASGYVTLALSSAAAGSLTGTDAGGQAGFQVLTDQQGAWTTPFTSSSAAATSATLTATLVARTSGAVMTTDPTAGAGWARAGIVVPPGRFRDQAKITVSTSALSLSTPARLVGGGKVRISGTASPGDAVELYARVSGTKAFSRVAKLTASASGLWSIRSTITRSTAYQARSGGKVSNTAATQVFSRQTVKARAVGDGRVAFVVHGRPDVRGTVDVSIGRRLLAHLTTDSAGDLEAVVQAKPGRKTFTIVFLAPGTTATPSKLVGEVV